MPDLQHLEYINSREFQFESLESGLSRSLQVANKWLASQIKPKSKIINVKALQHSTANLQRLIQMRVLLDILQGRELPPQVLGHPLITQPVVTPGSLDPPPAAKDTNGDNGAESTNQQPAAAGNTAERPPHAPPAANASPAAAPAPAAKTTPAPAASGPDEMAEKNRHAVKALQTAARIAVQLSTLSAKHMAATASPPPTQKPAKPARIVKGRR